VPVTEPKPPKWYDELSLNAFVSAGYLYNTNSPPDLRNNFRVFDSNANSFTLSVAEVTVQKAVSAAGDVGFRADFDLGGVIPQREVSFGDIPGNFNVRQALVSYIAPIGSGLRLDVGKYVTPVGYEVIEGWDNYNDNYSRSFLFNFAIPLTHTGAKVGYTLSPLLSVTALVANGWDAALAFNKGKMFGAQAVITPFEPLTISVGYLGGYEPPTPGVISVTQQYRQVVDVVAAFKVTPLITVGANFDYGSQAGASLVTPGDTAKWWGGAGYIRVETASGLGIALRGEYFKDEGGTRLGAAHALYEGTVTPYYKISGHWMMRLEGRVDASPDNVYTKSDGTLGTTQPTVAINALDAY
jgi:hypothetical protein